jgi:iron complex outermembrane receptor protein
MTKLSSYGFCRHGGSLLLLIAVNAAFADPSFTERDLLGDIPVVSAASRFEQRLDQAPASITTIDRELIALSGAQTFVDLFRLVPGFQSYHVSGNRYGISYHGIGREFPNQIEVMVDGRSVYESIFSSVSWGTLGVELSDIDHIEVIRGSNAAAQGSNAFMGSINIVTRKPVQDSGLAASATVGDWQTRKGWLRYNDSLGALDYRISLGYDNNEGFPAVTSGELNDGRELSHADFSATYTPSLIDALEFSAGYAHDQTGWGDADHPNEFLTAHAFSHFQSLVWKRSGDNNNDYEVHLYHNRFKIVNQELFGNFSDFLGIDRATADFLTSLNPVPMPIVNQVAADVGIDSATAQLLINELNTQVYTGFGRMFSERYDAQFQHTFRVSETLRGTWGVGLRHESLDAFHPQSVDIDVDELVSRFFTHGEWRATGQLTFNAGAMIEDTPQGVLLSPRLSANYQFLPNQTLRLAYVRGNRAPSLLEANERLDNHVGDLVVNVIRKSDPHIEEEKLDSFELGYLVQLRDPALTMDLRLFRENLSDTIDEESDYNIAADARMGDLFYKKLTNRGSWNMVGAEIQFSYRPTPKSLIRMHYTNIDLDTPAEINLSTGFAVATKGNRMATHSGGLLLAHKLKNAWTFSTMVYYQSEVRWEDGDAVPGFTRVDTQLMYDFQWGKNHGDIRFIVQNIGDAYAEFNDNNHFETRYFVTAQLKLP